MKQNGRTLEMNSSGASSSRGQDFASEHEEGGIG